MLSAQLQALNYRMHPVTGGVPPVQLVYVVYLS